MISILEASCECGFLKVFIHSVIECNQFQQVKGFEILVKVYSFQFIIYKCMYSFKVYALNMFIFFSKVIEQVEIIYMHRDSICES